MQTLYRFWAGTELLYIGISSNAYARMSQHKSNGVFFEQADHVTFEPYTDRVSVLVAEKLAILAESPKYNVVVMPKESLHPNWKTNAERVAKYQENKKQYVDTLEKKIIALSEELDRVKTPHPLAALIALAEAQGKIVGSTQGVVLFSSDDSENDIVRFICMYQGKVKHWEL